jgi:hypothetical protein
MKNGECVGVGVGFTAVPQSTRGFAGKRQS